MYKATQNHYQHPKNILFADRIAFLFIQTDMTQLLYFGECQINRIKKMCEFFFATVFNRLFEAADVKF
jgi:hypothetical protein